MVVAVALVIEADVVDEVLPEVLPEVVHAAVVEAVPAQGVVPESSS